MVREMSDYCREHRCEFRVVTGLTTLDCPYCASQMQAAAAAAQASAAERRRRAVALVGYPEDDRTWEEQPFRAYQRAELTHRFVQRPEEELESRRRAHERFACWVLSILGLIAGLMFGLLALRR